MRYRLFFFCGFLFLLTACNNKSNKIGFLLPNTVTDRYIKEKVYFTERAKELGFETLFADANYDPYLQIKQAQDIINQGAKVLVISSVNINISAKIARIARKQNIKIIAYDRFMLHSDIDFYITFKYKEIGQKMIEEVSKLKPKGTYIIFEGDNADFNAIQILQGQTEALQPLIKNGNINVVFRTFIEDWNADISENETKIAINLSNQYPDAIIASSDKIALGVIRALKTYNLHKKTIVTGMDADLLACKRILDSSQTISFFKPIKQLAIIAAETAVNIAKTDKIPATSDLINNGFKDVPVIFLSPQIVNRSNLKEIVINSGMYSESEIFQQ